MSEKNTAKLLSGNTYPGRGIMVGKTSDGKHAAVAYFIMGRSSNSRNRVFVKTPDGIKTQAFNPALLEDPSLIIYHPVRTLGTTAIVTNGDQTDTVYDYLKDGKTVEEALLTRCFEPDAPNYTPRINAVIDVKDSAFTYQLSILRTAENNPRDCERAYFNYSNPVNGCGHFIHTYESDGNPIPSFRGAPEEIEIGDKLDSFTDEIWSNLNADNKVSLYTAFINLSTGEYDERIINKNI
ncbi:MAG: inosine monophosphate cyclohydrolase [Clostridiales bacterium]|nr:inosine monophosphate cyclohydrolase [Clostridiales bacterium]